MYVSRFLCLALIICSTAISDASRADDKPTFFAQDCSRVSTDIPSDADGDTISDICEQALAEKFAPIVYHSSDESNYPTNVDRFLTKTVLRFHSARRPELNRKVFDKPSQKDLSGQRVEISNSPSMVVTSDGTRSEGKETSFYLEDVAEEFRRGSTDSREWTTYFHAYPNDQGGITIQYWRFYAYNDAANNHGGDWEGVHIILDDNLRLTQVGLLGHMNIDYKPVTQMQIEGNHVRVFSEGGGHGTRAIGNGIKARNCGGGVLNELLCTINLAKPATFVRQETWTNGEVVWYDGRKDRTGNLTNVGEKIKPMNGQVFLQYSGLWGSPSSAFGLPSYFSFSGYWGPAFNETGMRDDKFVTAWCAGMKTPSPKECFATTTIP